MKSLIHILITITIASAVVLTGCKQSMVINKVDYSQPVESVLTPNENGIVEDVQQGISFSIMPIQYQETQDTSSVTTKEVRFIRGHEGYYYITAPDYENVYIMEPEAGKLKLKNSFVATEEGLAKPAFNQRSTYIQLVNRDTGQSWEVRPDGIQEESQMTNRENQ